MYNGNREKIKKIKNIFKNNSFTCSSKVADMCKRYGRKNSSPSFLPAGTSGLGSSAWERDGLAAVAIALPSTRAV